MNEPHQDQAEKRKKRIVLALLALLGVVAVITMIWWGNLADPDTEVGPVEPLEAITDSADDERPKPPAD